MKTWQRVLLITLAAAVPAFILGPMIWPPNLHGDAPVGLQLLLFMLLAALDARGRACADVQAADAADERQAAAKSASLVLTEQERMKVPGAFREFVGIRGASGKEQEIRARLKTELAALGAVEIPTSTEGPLNLAMEFPASPGLAKVPGLLLNAHIDTVPHSDPARMQFEAASGDFVHRDTGVPGKTSSFGGDDRSSVAAIVSALRAVHARYWAKGVAHRRIVVLFTADEERHMAGARFIAREQPQLFADLEIAIAMDGPLDLESRYPEDSFVAVVARADEAKAPYDRVLRLVSEYCRLSGRSFGRTELGLGMGDFAAFPAAANAGLHLRSPVRGWHNNERVGVRDLVSHADLLAFLLLRLDDASLLPAGP